ncbi:MAG: hypothetical protein A2Z66_08665 [Chloroflexi bacterium RBG_13_66_10]|nr:MAG: hypothetical protein A2Z66_08665 [Chloroflexi bacterium RBG_13_66_10]
MNEIERYIRDVLRHIPPFLGERGRIEADLRAHMEEAAAGGDAPRAVIDRMGRPEDVAEELMSRMTFRFAGFWPRLAAYAVDLLVIVAAGSLFAIPAVALANLVPQHPAGWEYVLGGTLILATVVCALTTVGVVVFYFPILEGRFGRTPGKRLVRLWVLKENGLPIGCKEAFLRRLSYYFEIQPVDALFILFNDRRQRAFDIVARTVVVHER